jgi:hypothetical protein
MPTTATSASRRAPTRRWSLGRCSCPGLTNTVTRQPRLVAAFSKGRTGLDLVDRNGLQIHTSRSAPARSRSSRARNAAVS